jgi:hypothetical protein
MVFVNHLQSRIQTLLLHLQFFVAGIFQEKKIMYHIIYKIHCFRIFIINSTGSFRITLKVSFISFSLPIRSNTIYLLCSSTNLLRACNCLSVCISSNKLRVLLVFVSHLSRPFYIAQFVFQVPLFFSRT